MSARATLLEREERRRARLEDLRSRTHRPRPALRRRVLHGRADDAHLLPADVSGEARQVEERRVLPDRGRGRARGLPAVPAMSTRDGAGDAGVEGAAATVARALRLIERGFLDGEARVEDLADTLGMTARHLRRLFLRHAGASPTAVATTRRVQRAKALVDSTAMSMSAIAFASGFASIRRFNSAFRSVYRRSPTAVRHARPRRGRAGGARARRAVAESRAPWQSSRGRSRPWQRAR